MFLFNDKYILFWLSIRILSDRGLQSMIRINLVSNPRNLSTALMYSFAERPDTSVVDEPFYGHYLSNNNLCHPGRDEIIESMETDLARVKTGLLEHIPGKEVLFIKNMAQHLESESAYWFQFKNVVYIRDPKQLISSFSRVIRQPTMDDIGIKKQFKLYQFLSKKQGSVYVLDSGEILKNPEKCLQKLCAALEIPFLSCMLQWSRGPRKEDGVWAKYWYSNVHQSTGFSRQKTSQKPLPGHCLHLYEEAMHYYSILSEISIKI
jgi:hypothetical protein